MSLFCCLRIGSDKGDSATSNTDESLKHWDIFEDEGENYQKDLWQQVVDQKSARVAAAQKLLPVKSAAVTVTEREITTDKVSQPTADNLSPNEFLQSLTTLYNQNGCSQRMPRVRQTFTSLQPFVIAVNSLVQMDTVAALVWGSLHLLFESVLLFAKFWEDLQTMLESLTVTLPRFHGYIQVLHTPRLHAALREVYSTFLEICLMALDCVLADKCYAVLRIQWSSLMGKLEEKAVKLKTANSEFEKEARLAQVQEEAKRHREILTILQHERGTASTVFKTNIVLPRNEKFTGRDSDLALLHSTLECGISSNAEARRFSSTLIHAIGGMGKTEIALEYTYRFRKYFSHIFWLRSQTRALLQESFLDVVSRLGLATDDSRIQANKVLEIGLRWLQDTEEPWLLIFDNAEDLATLRDFWPASTHGAAIITSQNPSLSHMTKQSILLNPMPPSEGSALIQNYLNRGGSEQEPAEVLSTSLGGLPLAIVHFTGYIARSNCPVEQISRNLGQRLRASTIWKMTDDISVSTRAYQHTLDTVWDLAFHRLTEDAMALLEYIAFLDPDDIPAELFIGKADKSHEATIEWRYWEIDRFNDAIQILCERHLVTRSVQEGSDTIRTHRSLQTRILQKLDSDIPRRLSRFTEVVGMIRKAVPKANITERSDASQFGLFSKYLPQAVSIRTVFVQSEPAITGPVEFASVLSDFGFYTFTTYSNNATLALAETALAICENLSNDAVAQRLLPDILVLISQIIHYRGIKGRERGLEIMRRVVKLRDAELEKTPRQEWTETQKVTFARSHADLAWELCELDRLEEAAPLIAEAIGVYRTMGAEIRLNQVLINQLMILSCQRKVDETREQGETALQALKKIIANDNPLMTLMEWQVALTYFTIGDVGPALDMMQYVFQQYLMLLGNSHDLTLATQYCIAVYSQRLGNLTDAEQNLRKVLEYEHPTDDWREEDIVRTKFRLSLVLREQRRLEDSVEIRQGIESYLAAQRPVGSKKEYTDADDAELLDYGVTLCHGRTTGKWSNGEMW